MSTHPNVYPPWVGGQNGGAGGRVEGGRMQGEEATGFPPGATEQENVEAVAVQGGGKILYQKNIKSQKKIHKNKQNTKKRIKTNENTKNKIKTRKQTKHIDNVVPLTLLTVNANGLKKKVESLKSNIKHFNVGIFTIQETNHRRKGQLKVNEFDIFEAIRKKDGGGTMIGAHKTLNPILIEEQSDEVEMVVIEVTIGDKSIRVLSGYGPQECWPLDQRLAFFQALEEEVVKAELAGKSVIISFDANSKMGESHIPGDPNRMSENGKLLDGVLERHALIVANGLKGKTAGIITRERTTRDRVEKSAIDLVCLSTDLVDEVEKVTIDEEKHFALENIAKTKKGVKVTKSDHNSIITEFNLNRKLKVKSEKVETFNLKNKDALEKFKKLTSEKGVLTSKVKDEDDINNATNKFLKRLNGCVQQCF